MAGEVVEMCRLRQAKQPHVSTLSCELSSICKMLSGCPGKQGKHERPWPGLEAATKAAPSVEIRGCHHAAAS